MMPPSALWGFGCQELPHHCWPKIDWASWEIQTGGDPESLRPWNSAKRPAGDTARSYSRTECVFTPPAKGTAEPTHPGKSSCGQRLPQFKSLISTLSQNPTDSILADGFLRTYPRIGPSWKRAQRSWREFGQRESLLPPKNRHIFITLAFGATLWGPSGATLANLAATGCVWLLSR